MGIRFFHRFPLIGRLVTLNVSKGGVSVSAGVPGAHVTTGTYGSRVTVGVPGTGLFYTKVLTLQTPSTPSTPSPQAAWLAELIACAQRPFDPAAFAAVLNRMKDYGITDADLQPELRAIVEQIRDGLREEFGYRIEKSIETPPPIRPAPSLAIPLVILSLLIGTAIVATWWLMQ